MQADFQDYIDVLSKFINFIKETEIIYDYVQDCGTCEQNIEEEVKGVAASYGSLIFSVGKTDKDEVCDVFAILSYIVEKNLSVYCDIALGYSSDSKYQNKIKCFNERFVMILIRHIERYLTKIGIDMGMDEKTTYSITVNQGQVNIANENSTICANNYFGVEESKLLELIQNIKNEATSISPEEREIMESNLEVIQEEMKSSKPKKAFIKSALHGLKAIKSTVEFAAAVTSLISFITALL